MSIRSQSADENEPRREDPAPTSGTSARQHFMRWLRPRAGETSLVRVLTNPSLLFRDLISGCISALVTLCYAMSFAAMIFSGELATHLDAGVRMSLISAGVTIILVALTSPFYFAVAGPDSRSAAVQKALGAGLVASLHTAGVVDKGPLVILALSISTTLTGVALYVLGRLKMGSWIRYVPYPVIGGFLVSTGWVLLIGGISVVTNTTVTLDSLPTLLRRGTVEHLGAGVAMALLMYGILGRPRHFLWLPGILIGGTLATHLALLGCGISVAQGQALGWLLQVGGAGQVPNPRLLFSIKPAILSVAAGNLVEVLVLVSVTAIAVLVTGAAIEVATKRDSDLDQELRGHGIANIVSGLLGGVVGSNAIARSTLNLQAGALTRFSGVLAGMSCLLILAINPKLAGYLSRPVMGAILLYLSMRLIEEWLVKARKKLTNTDYLLVVLMFLLVVVLKTFVIALVVGAVASCLIFAVNYSRVSVVRNQFTVDEYGSKVQRSAEEHQVLRAQGPQSWVLRLRGYLFFGSIVGLVNQIHSRIRSQSQNMPLRVVVLDFRYVNGMDSSAALALVKLRQIIEECNMQLVLSHLQAEMETVLRREGCVRNDNTVLVFSDLDHTLEWCEQRVLDQEPSLHRIDLPFVQRLGKEFGSVDTAQRFMSYVNRIELRTGEYLFRQDDDSGATYVVESGRLSILYEPDKGRGPRLLLRSVTGNTTIGEMGLYRQSLRSASVVANAPSVIYRLMRPALERMEVEEPKVAAAFHVYVVRTLADRLYLMDKALSALER